jgi:hypothetical protein
MSPEEDAMKKLIAVLLLLLIVFVIVMRHRLFVRDPLANVARNGAKEPGAQVFINIDNDVLIENDHAPMYVELVQKDQPVAAPTELKCLHFMVCLLDAYPATLVVPIAGASIESMDAKTVRFVDSGKRETVVSLR